MAFYGNCERFMSLNSFVAIPYLHQSGRGKRGIYVWQMIELGLRHEV